MTPQAFSFKVTVPPDPDSAGVVAVVAAHAAEYAKVDAAKGAAFVERVRAAVAQAMTSADGKHCAVVFTGADGQLTMTIGGHTVTEPLPA